MKKMKNFLAVPLIGENVNYESVNVAVSHREILRLRDRFFADQMPYTIINFSSPDPSDLNAHESGSRYFHIVKK